MNKQSKIYLAGHRGLVGSAILRKLAAEGYTNILTRSHSDLDLTRRINRSAQELGLRVLDHLVVTEGAHFSFQDAGFV